MVTEVADDKKQPKKRRPTSPTLELEIREEDRQRAVDSNSGACLIADAIKEQYPHLTRILVDMATIRVSDSAKGYRYTYLTPQTAQHVLLAFDQGWPNPAEHLQIKRAVQITPIIGGKHPGRTPETRAARRDALQARIDAGETLTRSEKATLTRLKKDLPARPTSTGPVEFHNGTVHGGPPRVVGPPHPNLLRGRNRIFGAKLADPGTAFNNAVQQGVQAELASQAAVTEATN